MGKGKRRKFKEEKRIRIGKEAGLREKRYGRGRKGIIIKIMITVITIMIK